MTYIILFVLCTLHVASVVDGLIMVNVCQLGQYVTLRLHVWIAQRSVSLCASLCMTVVGGSHLLWQHSALCSDNQMNSQQVAALCVQVPICG